MTPQPVSSEYELRPTALFNPRLFPLEQQRSVFYVQRSIDINSDAKTVFDAGVNFGTWTKWSPWLCSEPKADVQITGDDRSVGSVYSWQGQIVGHGEIEYRNLKATQLMEDEIRFFKPFKTVSRVSFEIQPAADRSKITWHMNESLPWFMFWMRSLMESLIGMDYDRSLKMLKEWIETGKVLSKTNIRGIETVGPLRMIGVRTSAHMNNVGPAMRAAIESASLLMSNNNLPTDGQMISVCHNLNMKSQILEFTRGYVIPASTAVVPTGLSEWSIPTSNAFCVEHVGSYQNIGNAWIAANQHVRNRKLNKAGQGV